jgi:hypothetical protein
LKNVTNVDQGTSKNRHDNHPFEVPLGDLLQRWIVLTANEHVPVHVHEHKKYVGAHFNRLAKVGYEHNFVQLSDC